MAKPVSLTRRIFFHLPLGLLLLAAIGWAMLPSLIKVGLSYWAFVHGADSAVISSIVVRPIEAGITLRDVEIKRQGKSDIEIGEISLYWDWRELFSHGGITLDQLLIRNGKLVGRHHDGHWRWAGMAFSGGSSSSPALNLNRIDLSAIEVTLDQGPQHRSTFRSLTAHVRDLRLGGLVRSGEIEARTLVNRGSLVARGELVGTASSSQLTLKIDGHQIPGVAVMRAIFPKITWGGQGEVDGEVGITFAYGSETKQRFDLAGKVTAKLLTLDLAGQQLQLANALWSGAIGKDSDESTCCLRGKQQLRSDSWQWRPSKGYATVAADLGSWQLEFGSTKVANKRLAKPQLGLRLAATKMRVVAAESNKSLLSATKVAATGAVKDWRYLEIPQLTAATLIIPSSAKDRSGESLFRSLSAAQISSDNWHSFKLGAVRADHATVTLGNDKRFGNQWLELKDLLATEATTQRLVKITTSRLTAKRTQLYAQPAKGGKRSWLHAQSSLLKGLSVKNLNSTTLEQLELKGASLMVERGASGKWHSPLLGSSADSKGKNRLQWRVKRFWLDPPAQFALIDTGGSKSHPYDFTLSHVQLKELRLGGKPHRSSFELAAEFNPYSTIKAAGEVTPGLRATKIKLESTFSGINLPDLNPYLRHTLGHQAEQGHMQGKLSYSTANDEMTMIGRLTLDRALLEQVASGNERHAAYGAGLDMLKDKKQRVSLDLNLSGPVNDPTFKLDYAIGSAVSKSLKTAAVLAYQPLLALVGTGKLLGAIFKTRFDSISFAPGSDTLDSIARKSLADIAAQLAQKEEVAITICGQSSKSERTLLKRKKSHNIDARLHRLARQRALAVQANLVEQGKIAPARLFVCRTEIDSGGSKPKVKISLAD